MKSARIAKDYINEQYTICQALNAAFDSAKYASVKGSGHFLGRDEAIAIWDTMYVLLDIKLVMDDEADTMDQMMELLKGLRNEYKRGVTPGGACSEANVVAAIDKIISDVTALCAD